MGFMSFSAQKEIKLVRICFVQRVGTHLFISLQVNYLDIYLFKGTFWNGVYGECLVPSNFNCCYDVEEMFICFEPRAEAERRCMKFSYNGVLLHGYKQLCREGYLWVPWRRKCFRIDNWK